MANNINSKKIRILAIIVVVIWAGAAIFAAGAGVDYYKTREKIQYKINLRNSPVVQKGWKIWIREGKYGYRNAVMKRVKLYGNDIIEESSYESEIVNKPVSAVLVLGTSKNLNPITVPKESYAHMTYDMESTAYDPSPESNSLEWAGITALGWRTRYGIVAVDPKVIPLRSLVFIEGYGLAWAGDTGGDIKGKRIDLCYNTTKQAMRWGRRKIKVYILGTKSWDYYKVIKERQKLNNEK
jgi:3D (Asp-Asp-Asp) domain-containing protein